MCRETVPGVAVRRAWDRSTTSMGPTYFPAAVLSGSDDARATRRATRLSPRLSVSSSLGVAADIRLVVGDYAVHQGDERGLFAVLEGRIEPVKHVDGIERVVGVRLPGEVFGESLRAALCSGRETSAPGRPHGVVSRVVSPRPAAWRRVPR